MLALVADRFPRQPDYNSHCTSQVSLPTCCFWLWPPSAFQGSQPFFLMLALIADRFARQFSFQPFVNAQAPAGRSCLIWFWSPSVLSGNPPPIAACMLDVM